MQITVRYRSVDGARVTRRYKSLPAAQKYAFEMIGEAPSLGCGYAVSDDGIGMITVDGATLRELFPKGF